MERTRHDIGRRALRRPRVVAVMLAAAALAIPFPVRSEVRPLVREMLANLASLNDVGASVALDDFEGAKRAAADLEARAGVLIDFDVSRIGIDPERNAEFDAYLRAQQQAARDIATAAQGQDGALVFRGVQRLLNEACVACHKQFRDPQNLMRPSTLFMASYLAAWQDMNRGMLTGDFTLVARRAHEIQSLGQVLAWDQVIASVFELADPEERSEFRAFLRHVSAEARHVEQAADEEKIEAVVEATRRMWTNGCLACHEQFRSGD
jgi:cytochrome c556